MATARPRTPGAPTAKVPFASVASPGGESSSTPGGAGTSAFNQANDPAYILSEINRGSMARYGRPATQAEIDNILGYVTKPDQFTGGAWHQGWNPYWYDRFFTPGSEGSSSVSPGSATLLSGPPPGTVQGTSSPASGTGRRPASGFADTYQAGATLPLASAMATASDYAAQPAFGAPTAPTFGMAPQVVANDPAVSAQVRQSSYAADPGQQYQDAYGRALASPNLAYGLYEANQAQKFGRLRGAF